MNILRPTHLALLTLTLTLLPSLSPADTITLKSGDILEGRITEETDDFVRIQVQVSSTIKDEKTIARGDIAKLSKLTEEDIAFEDVNGLIPTPSLLTSNDYANLIRSKVDRFLKTYPTSKYRPEAEKVLEQLNEEKNQADKGSLKLENTWYSQRDQRRDRSNIDAKILHFKMRQKAAAGDYVGALRDFDEIDADYRGTDSFIAALGDALTVLESYNGTVTNMLRDYGARMKERAKKLLLLREHERVENEAVFKRGLERHKAAIAAEKERGYRWLTLNRDSEESLKETLATIASEATRVKEIDSASQEKAARLMDQAKTRLEERNLRETQRNLDQAKEILGAANLYLASVQKLADQLKQELVAAADANKKSKSDEALELISASKTMGTDAASAGTGNALKAMMERKRAAKEKKKAEAAKAASAAAAPKPAPAATPPHTPMPRPVAAKGGGGLKFQHVVFIIAGLMIAVTGGAVVMQKRKK
ncbi:MAG: PTPDL family protein [Verrucomicrobiales bacterium]